MLFIFVIFQQAVNNCKKRSGFNTVVFVFQRLLCIGDGRIILSLAEIVICSVYVSVIVFRLYFNRSVIMLESGFVISFLRIKMTYIAVDTCIVGVYLQLFVIHLQRLGAYARIRVAQSDKQ